MQPLKSQSNSSMLTIGEIQKEYFEKIDRLDLDLIVGDVMKKPREFVMTHPEFKLSKVQGLKIKSLIARRMKHEPIAYILGHKEFFGLDFKVTPDTLIPRPETELLVEEVLKLAPKNRKIMDIGTGSGNIIISLAKNLPEKNNFVAIDISKKALTIARHNAKLHKVDKKIKFLHGNLLDPIIKNRSMFHAPCSMIILANLPYLSKEIYSATLPDVKKY
jgi:release factor glutamine methyltransferase